MASYCGLSFEIQVTGDCSNTSSGSFSVAINGNAPDYTIQFISPTTDVYYLGNNVTATTFTSLSAGTYVFEVIDSCLTAGTPNIGSAYISSGTTVTCIDISNTSYDTNNGSITAQTSNFYNVSSFYLYDYYNGYITSGNSFFDYFIFDSLSASTYYVIADDGGGCTGQSETVIIKSSTTFDYGFYVINESGCNINNGKIFITGLTGNGPYTYLWNNGQTTSSISGLSAGGYTVSVTDKDSVELKKGTTVNKVPRLSYVTNLQTAPSCYGSDGQLTYIISGGTPPYNYQLSNGITNVSFLTSITIPNLSAGDYTMTVTDAGTCVVTTNFSLLSPKGLNVVSVNTTTATCDLNNGTVSIRLVGGSPPYTYVLTNQNGKTTNYTTQNQSQIFSNLYEGEYTLSISDLGPCTFEETVTIGSVNSFQINTNVYDITCSNEYGSVGIEVVGDGVSPYTYQITGKPSVTKNQKEMVFEYLDEGSYLVQVIDSSGCTQTTNVYVGSGNKVNFNYLTKKTKDGVDGKIDLYITQGTPPFEIVWSDNVGGQTGKTLTNLSAGTYDVTVTDGNGCAQTRSLDVGGTNLISSYQIYNVCDSDLSNSGEVLKKGLQQMLLEGFYDLTYGDNNCVLNQAIFTAIVNLSGITSTAQFYTTESLNDFPFDNDFYTVVEQILLTYDGIDNVIFNSNTNQVVINTGCGDQNVSLIDFPIQVSVQIDYDITCESCDGASVLPFFPYVVMDYGIYGFDPQNRIFLELPESDKYTSILGATRSPDNSKLWVLNDTGNSIFEYDVISLIPYIVTFNREINLSSTISRALTYVNSTTLYGGNDSSQYISSIDLINGNVANGIFLSTVPFTVVDNTLLINLSGNTIVLTHDIDGFQYIRQYDSVSNLLVEINLPATIGYTMYEYDSVFYLVDLGNYQVYSILTTSPYTLTPEFIIEPPVTTNTFIMSQINTYVTTNFT
jgi:hypothetical protein